ncbi:DUF3857 domain-containing protein [Carboxylicivirga sp. N1Y90]|uniref:DUF3857 domain-containing protein n=1 Tax=Carboxylicivirga fragile TaxID=3417571 RepID=UPI003D3549C7|nr:DUF3857 domain-containing protein [Marinilabiliaceae bacterium N1Y90]
MKSKVTILLLMVVSICHAIEHERKFGLLTPEELALKACEFEKDAPAVVLFDKAEATFREEEGEGFVISMKRHVRIKIFDEAGFDQSEIEIRLAINGDSREKIRDIKAISYNHKNNQLTKTPLEKSQIFTEKLNKYWYQKKFALPEIQEGTIIEYTYTLTSPFITHFTDWEFQTDIPTLYSEFKAAMIPFYSYRYRLQGTNRLDHKKNYEKNGIERSFNGVRYNDMVYEFGLKNIPSFKDESFISSRNDYILKLDFQLVEINHPSGYSKKFMDTWPSLANELLDSDSFGKYLKKAEKWADKNANHFIDLPEEKRYSEILNYVKNNYQWNEYNGKLAQHSLKDLNKKLSGNIANLNLLAIGIMRSNGLNAEPIIISTRNHGKVSDQFPYSDLFNYVLILSESEGKYRLLDATLANCPNALIPSRCINGKGFIVKEDSESWININTSHPSTQVTAIDYSIDVDNYEMVGSCQTKCTGYIALDKRSSYVVNPQKFEEGLERYGKEEDSELEVKHLEEKEKPLTYSYDFKESIDIIDEQIIISPFANFAPKNNPFKQEKRALPIDLVNKKGYQYIAAITIPKGYKIDVLPMARKMESDNVEFNFKAQAVGTNKIQIVALYKYKKSSYSAKSYNELKQFMNTVTDKMNSKIVLVKEDLLSQK